MFAVPLCCDFIIPHQYWQLCDENKNVFGIFNFIMCSNKQCIWEFIKFVLNVISAVTHGRTRFSPTKQQSFCDIYKITSVKHFVILLAKLWNNSLTKIRRHITVIVFGYVPFVVYIYPYTNVAKLLWYRYKITVFTNEKSQLWHIVVLGWYSF